MPPRNLKKCFKLFLAGFRQSFSSKRGVSVVKSFNFKEKRESSFTEMNFASFRYVKDIIEYLSTVLEIAGHKS